MLCTAICDDDEASREYMKTLMKQTLDCKISMFKSGEDLLSSNIRFDIVLLDISMEGMNGIEAAERIKKRSDAVIIFVTALREYVFDAFDVGAFHYLLKPIEVEKFQGVLRKAVAEKCVKENREPLVIKSGGTYHNILPESIYYAESRGRKVALHMDNGLIEYYGKIGELEETLHSLFFRSHRGYLVNLAKISEYGNTELHLQNGETIFLAKQKYHEFVERYMQYLKE